MSSSKTKLITSSEIDLGRKSTFYLQLPCIAMLSLSSSGHGNSQHTLNVPQNLEPLPIYEGIIHEVDSTIHELPK